MSLIFRLGANSSRPYPGNSAVCRGMFEREIPEAAGSQQTSQRPHANAKKNSSSSDRRRRGASFNARSVSEKEKCKMRCSR